MKKIRILTFDIEDWFHLLGNKSTRSPKEWLNFEYRLEKNINYIFEILDNQNLKASFFSLGWVARKFPEIIKKIDELGYEIGSHSDIHQLIHHQKRKEFKEDLDRSIKSIEDLIGKKVKMYRAPGFSLVDSTKWVFDELIASGIEIDASLCSRKMFNGGLVDFQCTEPSIISTESGQIKEFPINLFSFIGNKIVFSGGGYFRFFPYQLIKKMTIQSSYVMTYFHPRDFDIDQPIIPNLDFLTKFRAYYGINNCYNKLNKLTADFDFIDIDSAVEKINWSLVDNIIV